MYEKRFKFSEPKRDTGYIDIPMVLFTDPVLSEISIDAKFMYSILFDILQRRSYDNGWVDDKGRIYVMTRPDELKRSFRNSVERTKEVLAELDQKGLIEWKRCALGGPDMIYLMNIFAYAENNTGRQKA